MEVFYHHIYEFQKGLRHLILCTVKADEQEKIKQRLKRENIAYYIQDIGHEKINVFFGNNECIEVVRSFNKLNLNELTPQEDFILGIMLGYDRLLQCKRYLKLINVYNSEKAMIG